MNTGNISGITRTLREIFTGRKYFLREKHLHYAWSTRHAKDLIKDLASSFYQDFDYDDSRPAVANYRQYFLGTIVTSIQGEDVFLFDGSHRLITLSLLLIHLHHETAENPAVETLLPLIFSQRFGARNFHIDLKEQARTLDYILGRNEVAVSDDAGFERTLWKRFADIERAVREEVESSVIPYFVDWLLERLILIEISVPDHNTAEAIASRMNSRGLKHRQGPETRGLPEFQFAKEGEAKIAFPIPEPGPSMPQEEIKEPDETEKKHKKAPIYYGVHVTELLDAHLVFPGEGIFASSSGKDYRGIITAAGTIISEGKEYASLSGAAQALMGRPMSGWDFWKVQRGSKLVSLFNIRREYLNKFPARRKK